MKNFKRILAVVLAVLCVVPAMAFSASAETTVADYWTAAGKNAVSALDGALAPYDNAVSIYANEDGSVSVRDVAVEFQGAYSNDPITAVTANYPTALNGSSTTIVPVGTDVDGDGEAEYAYSYSFFYTNNPVYTAGQTYCKGNGYPNYNGFYTGSTIAGEYTYGVALSDNMSPIPWAPTYFDKNVDNNGEAEYCIMTIINDGNYWTADICGLDMPVVLSEKLSVEIFANTDLDEDGEADMGVILNAYDDAKLQYVFGTCGDCYDGYDANGMFTLVIGASANGVNTHTASFDIVEVNGETDVANFSSTYCKADAHAWGDAVVTEATCTEDGTSTIVCATCGYTKVDVVAEATGHAYEETIVPAACETAGSSTKVCATCGDTVVAEIPATGHAYTVKHWITIPTAEAAGTARLSCAVCGDIADELASVEASWDAFWTVGAKNDMAAFDANFASLNDTAYVTANEDGTLTVLDAASQFAGAYNNDAITAMTTNFKSALNGASAEIEPIGADVDGDGELEYAFSYSFFFTNGANPAYASGKTYCKGMGFPNYNGFYTGTTTAGEYTYGVAFTDSMSPIPWAPDNFGANVDDNGAAEYVVMTIINGGNYWTADIRQLDVPVDFSEKLSVEIFSNTDLDEDGAVDLGLILNAYDEEKTQYIFGSCADCYADFDGPNAFQVAIGASANGVNTHSTSFKINSVNGEAPATYAGSGEVAVTVPTVTKNRDLVTISDAAYVKDIIVISGEGYTGYADIKAAKATADYYYRVTYAKLEGYSYTYDLEPNTTYTVLTRTVDGAEHLTVVTTEAWGGADTNSSGRVKFWADKEIRVIRFAPGAGLDTVAALKAADGYKAIKRAAFLAYDAEAENMADHGVETLRLFPALGTYSYVIEYVDGTKEFGEFTTEGNWDDEGKEPVFAADGITNMVQNRFIKAYYAAGNYNSVKEIKAAEGYRVILKDYTVRDTEIVTTETVDPSTGEVTVTEEVKNLSTRHYNFKKPLSGEYTFAIVWGNAAAPAIIYHVTF